MIFVSTDLQKTPADRLSVGVFVSVAFDSG
jgi:hypothetical protein